MSTLDSALSLAARGFHVFPCKRNGKLPVIDDYPNRATTDPGRIRELWGKRDYNVGISTTRFGADQALVVVDVDTKKGKHGDQSLLELELSGLDIPLTLEHETPSGGRHLIYVCEQALRQGTDTLGNGLDIRSRGGYIVGPGSAIDGKLYQQINGHGVLAPAPEWLVQKLGVAREREAQASVPLPGVDPERARSRALAYLENAPLAVEGEAGDLTTFKVAAKLKDMGCSLSETVGLMAGFWNDLCTPPWDDDALVEKIEHAFRYGKEPQGSAAPEAVFPPAPPEPPAAEDVHPFDKMNSEFAFVKKGAFVLQETTDPKGAFTTEHLSLQEFHAWFANVPWAAKKGKAVSVSQAWVESSKRRQYEGVVFMPELNAGPRWYNLWRGFTVEPIVGSHPSVEAFKEHALENVCGGDQKLYRWLMGYFAHMIQKPWEKPLVAIVFKGKKGTGKNALVERVGNLFGPHFLVADDDRYLLSNFNSHLESNLFFVLDEAAWAGDKKAESRLKGLITGTHHNIERKGKEPYRVDNLTRVAIIGNESWIIPATADERRFAVFNVGEGRMQDRKFFHDMRVGMEQGGYAHLLHFLRTFDLTGIDVNDAPQTEGLTDQKMASLPPIEEWWFECLTNGAIAGGDFGGEWPEIIQNSRLRDALSRWAKGRNIKSRLPDERSFGKLLSTIAPHFSAKRSRVGDALINGRKNPGLEKLRSDWEKYIKGSIQWEEA